MNTSQALIQDALAKALGRHTSTSTSVHVGNLAPAVDTAMLITIFGCVGKIVDCRIASNGKYGFVDFEDCESAQTALSLNGTELVGQRIRVELTQTKRTDSKTGKSIQEEALLASDPLLALGISGQLRYQILCAVAQVIQHGMDCGLPPLAAVIAAFSGAGIAQQNFSALAAGAATNNMITPVQAQTGEPAKLGLLGQGPYKTTTAEASLQPTSSCPEESPKQKKRRSRSKSRSRSHRSKSKKHRRHHKKHRSSTHKDSFSCSRSNSWYSDKSYRKGR